MQSRPPPPRLEPVLRFIRDESPYGAGDMSGLVREYCSGWFRENFTRPARGSGVWIIGRISFFRAASRGACLPGDATIHDGFRVAARGRR